MPRDLEVIDFRSALRSGADITVGAYARRVRRRRMLVAGTGVVLVAAAALVYYALVPRGEGAPPGYPVLVRCVAEGCGFEGPIRVAAGQAFPVSCPKCSQRSCRAIWRCNDCGGLFLPEDSRGPACPQCRSQNVGSAAGVNPAPAGARRTDGGP